jgi:hypothetical protein
VIFFALLAAIFVPWYLAEGAILANSLKRDFPNEWVALGYPKAFDGSLLSLYFGRAKLPATVDPSLFKRLARIRITGSIAAVGVFGLFALNYIRGTTAA